MTTTRKTALVAADEPVTVTPELLAQAWSTPNAVRMWLKRRGVTPKELGLVIVPRSEGGVGLVAAEAQVDETEDASGLFTGASAAPATDEAFERFADEVDAALREAGVSPLADSVLRAAFSAGRAPSEVSADAIAAHAVPPAEVVVQLPMARPAEGELAYHHALAMSGIDCDLATARGYYERNIDVATAARELAPAAPAQAPSDQVYLRMADPVALEHAVGVAARIARQIGAEVLVCRVHDHSVVSSHGPKRARTPRVGSGNGDAKGKRTLPTILALLARETGASGPEVQATLGWESTPGPWFFKSWATKAGRADALRELPRGADNVRRWHLPAA